MNDLRKDCQMRHENGNCNVIGGFCTAVSDAICVGLHNAYDCGFCDGSIRAKLEIESKLKVLESNAPLTLDELRKMDGEPVWTVTIGISGSGRWELCTCETVCACPLHKVLRCVTANGLVTDYDLDTYGKTWLAYRQKPVEGTV